MSFLLEIMEYILELRKRKVLGSTFHFFFNQVRGPHFPGTGLYYCSSCPIFNNCMATTSVWFGRLQQKLAGTGGMLLPVCLPRACPHMYLWDTVCQVWCWIGKALLLQPGCALSVCGISNLYLLSKAPNHWQILIKNQSEFLNSRHVAYIYAAFSLLSKLYKKPKSVEISLDDDDDVIILLLLLVGGGVL